MIFIILAFLVIFEIYLVIKCVTNQLPLLFLSIILKRNFENYLLAIITPVIVKEIKLIKESLPKYIQLTFERCWNTS